MSRIRPSHIDPTGARRDAVDGGIGGRRAWWVAAGLVLLGIVPAIGGASRLLEIAGGAPMTPDNARFLSMPVPAVVHLLAVIPFSLLGAFQFVPALRRGGSRWHRRSGRALVGLGFVSALTGLWMTLVYPWPEGDGAALYVIRLVVGTAMTGALVLGVAAIVRRDFPTHGAWMLRAYALGMGAGTQVLTHLPWFILVGGWPGEVPRAVMMGGGWALNALVAEWLIQRGRERAGRRHLVALERLRQQAA